eukprot:Nitzschia sp. Nitz4//scaffold182_size44100//1163//2230//NITZ4_007245-RA/size44100-snap-gene-0.4-mRNA-1//-1//CDS//3329539538//23//frame0
MPPLDPNMEHSSSSFCIEEWKATNGPEYLRNLWDKVQNGQPPSGELQSKLSQLFKQANELDVKLESLQSSIVVRTATRTSIQSAVADAVDLLDDLGNERIVQMAANVSSQELKNLEHVISNHSWPLLDNDHPEVLEPMNPSKTRVTLWNSSPAIEFGSGPPVSFQLSRSKGNDSLPLKLSLVPILVMSPNGTVLQDSSSKSPLTTQLRVESCTHHPLVTAPESVICGELNVRVHFSPPVSALPSPGWEAGSSQPVDIWSMAQVRAVQTNSMSGSKIPCQVDLFLSSTYGDNGFALSMKLKTFRTVDNEVPHVEITLKVK